MITIIISSLEWSSVSVFCQFCWLWELLLVTGSIKTFLRLPSILRMKTLLELKLIFTLAPFPWHRSWTNLSVRELLASRVLLKHLLNPWFTLQGFTLRRIVSIWERAQQRFSWYCRLTNLISSLKVSLDIPLQTLLSAQYYLTSLYQKCWFLRVNPIQKSIL